MAGVMVITASAIKTRPPNHTNARSHPKYMTIIHYAIAVMTAAVVVQMTFN